MCVPFWREKLVTWSSVDTSKAGCLAGPKGLKIENLLSHYPHPLILFLFLNKQEICMVWHQDRRKAKIASPATLHNGPGDLRFSLSKTNQGYQK